MVFGDADVSPLSSLLSVQDETVEDILVGVLGSASQLGLLVNSVGGGREGLTVGMTRGQE